MWYGIELRWVKSTPPLVEAVSQSGAAYVGSGHCDLVYTAREIAELVTLPCASFLTARIR